MYRRYEYVEKVTLEVRARNKGLSKLDWIEKHGDMERLYAIALDEIERTREAAVA